ncbi:MAG: DUF455 family protein [Betaproteobacteria bacterium]|nr:MAG: DUF455 family protein [Betaproteobacteria bacterium]
MEEKEHVRARALIALCEPNPLKKSALAKTIQTRDERDWPPTACAAGSPHIPGRPSYVALVAPNELKRRSLSTVAGRAALVHALAHIEFNAINLALDAVWRFNEMPEAFALDWAQVASEEALHFELLHEHLAQSGFRYGDFPAHDGLWEMAERTKGDVLARMALVPRTLEARGLDASPSIRDKLRQAGDEAGAAIVQRILDDEIGHVATGNRWFRALCAARNLDPMESFAELCRTYRAPVLRSPFNVSARKAAGFTSDEIAYVIAADEEARQAARV